MKRKILFKLGVLQGMLLYHLKSYISGYGDYIVHGLISLYFIFIFYIVFKELRKRNYTNWRHFHYFLFLRNNGGKPTNVLLMSLNIYAIAIIIFSFNTPLFEDILPADIDNRNRRMLIIDLKLANGEKYNIYRYKREGIPDYYYIEYRHSFLNKLIITSCEALE